jgi:hypothetical protein
MRAYSGWLENVDMTTVYFMRWIQMGTFDESFTVYRRTGPPETDFLQTDRFFFTNHRFRNISS